MGTLLFFVGIENYQDEMLPKRIREPKRIATRQNGKYTEIRDYEFS